MKTSQVIRGNWGILTGAAVLQLLSLLFMPALEPPLPKEWLPRVVAITAAVIQLPAIVINEAFVSYMAPITYRSTQYYLSIAVFYCSDFGSIVAFLAFARFLVRRARRGITRTKRAS